MDDLQYLDFFKNLMCKILESQPGIQPQDLKNILTKMHQFSRIQFTKEKMRKFHVIMKIFCTFLNHFTIQFDRISAPNHRKVRMALDVFFFVVDHTNNCDEIIKKFSKLIEHLLENDSPISNVKEFFRTYYILLDKISEKVLKELVISLKTCYILLKIVQSIGDLETQAVIIGVLFKLNKFNNIKASLKMTFPKILKYNTDTNIYQNIRMVLDEINESGENIFSINCSTMELNGNRIEEFLKAPITNDIWLDFNLLESKISFFCSSDFYKKLGNGGWYGQTWWQVLAFEVKNVLKMDYSYNSMTENLEISIKLRGSSFEILCNTMFDRIDTLTISISRYSERFPKLVQEILPKLFPNFIIENLNLPAEDNSSITPNITISVHSSPIIERFAMNRDRLSTILEEKSEISNENLISDIDETNRISLEEITSSNYRKVSQTEKHWNNKSMASSVSFSFLSAEPHKVGKVSRLVPPIKEEKGIEIISIGTSVQKVDNSEKNQQIEVEEVVMEKKSDVLDTSLPIVTTRIVNWLEGVNPEEILPIPFTEEEEEHDKQEKSFSSLFSEDIDRFSEKNLKRSISRSKESVLKKDTNESLSSVTGGVQTFLEKNLKKRTSRSIENVPKEDEVVSLSSMSDDIVMSSAKKNIKISKNEENVSKKVSSVNNKIEMSSEKNLERRISRSEVNTPKKDTVVLLSSIDDDIEIEMKNVFSKERFTKVSMNEENVPKKSSNELLSSVSDDIEIFPEENFKRNISRRKKNVSKKNAKLLSSMIDDIEIEMKKMFSDEKFKKISSSEETVPKKSSNKLLSSVIDDIETFPVKNLRKSMSRSEENVSMKDRDERNDVLLKKLDKFDDKNSNSSVNTNNSDLPLSNIKKKMLSCLKKTGVEQEVCLNVYNEEEEKEKIKEHLSLDVSNEGEEKDKSKEHLSLHVNNEGEEKEKIEDLYSNVNSEGVEKEKRREYSCLNVTSDREEKEKSIEHLWSNINKEEEEKEKSKIIVKPKKKRALYNPGDFSYLSAAITEEYLNSKDVEEPSSIWIPFKEEKEKSKIIVKPKKKQAPYIPGDFSYLKAGITKNNLKSKDVEEASSIWISSKNKKPKLERKVTKLRHESKANVQNKKFLLTKEDILGNKNTTLEQLRKVLELRNKSLQQLKEDIKESKRLNRTIKKESSKKKSKKDSSDDLSISTIEPFGETLCQHKKKMKENKLKKKLKEGSSLISSGPFEMIPNKSRKRKRLFSTNSNAKRSKKDEATKEEKNIKQKPKINIISNILIKPGTNHSLPVHSSSVNLETSNFGKISEEKLAHQKYLATIQRLQKENSSALVCEETIAIANILNSVLFH